MEQIYIWMDIFLKVIMIIILGGIYEQLKKK